MSNTIKIKIPNIGRTIFDTPAVTDSLQNFDSVDPIDATKNEKAVQSPPKDLSDINFDEKIPWIFDWKATCNKKIFIKESNVSEMETTLQDLVLQFTDDKSLFNMMSLFETSWFTGKVDSMLPDNVKLGVDALVEGYLEFSTLKFADSYGLPQHLYDWASDPTNGFTLTPVAAILIESGYRSGFLYAQKKIKILAI
jgi:hypothetical protein